MRESPGKTCLNLVDRPTARASRRQEQENEAIEQCRLAIVQRREKALRKMRHEIRGGHETRENEGYRPGEKPDQKKKAADQFEQTGKDQQSARHLIETGQGRKSQKLS